MPTIFDAINSQGFRPLPNQGFAAGMEQERQVQRQGRMDDLKAKQIEMQTQGDILARQKEVRMMQEMQNQEAYRKKTLANKEISNLFEGGTQARLGGNAPLASNLNNKALALMGIEGSDYGPTQEALVEVAKTDMYMGTPEYMSNTPIGQQTLDAENLISKLTDPTLQISSLQKNLFNLKAEGLRNKFPAPPMSEGAKKLAGIRHPKKNQLLLSGEERRDLEATAQVLSGISAISEGTSLKLAEKDAAILKVRGTLEKMATFEIDPDTGERRVSGIKPEFAGSFGPIDGFLVSMRAKYGGDLQAARDSSEIKSIKKELYKITGRQLAVQEMETMIDSFLPQLSQPGTTAMVVLERMVHSLEREQNFFKQRLEDTGKLSKWTPEGLNEIWGNSVIGRKSVLGNMPKTKSKKKAGAKVDVGNSGLTEAQLKEAMEY